MKEIIGDDYPTYEDSVNMTLAEQKKRFNLYLHDRARATDSQGEHGKIDARKSAT